MQKLHFLTSVALAGLIVATPATAQEQAQADQSAISIDPARFAAAKTAVDYIFPAGTYAKMMMNGSFKNAINQMVDSTAQLPAADLAKEIGVKPDDLAKLDKAKLAEVMAIMDPAYKQRMDAVMDAMVPDILDMASSIEPSVRGGLANALAKDFTLAQLNDMNRFFATSSGSAFAGKVMLLEIDPEVIKQESTAAPAFLQQFKTRLPAMEQKMMAALAKTPKPRDYKDLTRVEKARIAKLLGTDQGKLG